jgi:crotonobetainyl-CoA:carnitine CoA-transferase CaiB-like acyl-CoA transferase
MTTRPDAPLHGVRVLDLTEEHGGALCAMHLADLGAHVVRVAPGDETFAHRGRHVLGLTGAPADDATDRLASLADVVVDDRPRSRARRGDGGFGAHTVSCWMPAFAPEHELGDERARPGLVEAYAGLHEVPLGRRPAAHSMPLLAIASAAQAACGIVSALIARRRDGRGQRVTLNQHDVAYGLLELNAMFTVSPPRSWATLQWAATPFIGGYAARDGRTIYIHAGLARHVPRLIDALRPYSPTGARALEDALTDEVRADPTSIPSAPLAARLRAALSEAFSAQPAETWERALSGAGLCAVVARGAEEWLAHPHPRESGHVVELDGRRAPGPVCRVGEGDARGAVQARASSFTTLEATLEAWEGVATPARTQKPSRHAPLHGVRVLDFTQVIAGPTATRTLAELGAEVRRVDNPHFRAPWVEAFHIAFNAGKDGGPINLTTQGGQRRLGELLEGYSPDVVVQNLRPGAAEAVGIDAARIAARTGRDDFVYAHMTAYGTTGPWGDRPGWEQTAQAACGIQAAWGGEGAPDLYPLPLNDLCTGLHGALGVLAALYAGGGARVETSLIASATLTLARATCDGAPMATGKKSLGATPLTAFYPVADGWARLHAESLEDLQRVEGLEGARGSGDALTQELTRAFEAAPWATWRERVRAAGVADRVSLVPRRTQRQVLTDPRARSQLLVHPRHHDGPGLVTETGSALRLSHTPLVHLEPAYPLVDGANPRGVLGWASRQAVGALSLAWGRLKG